MTFALRRWLPLPSRRPSAAREWRLECLEDRTTPAPAYAVSRLAAGAGGESTEVRVYNEAGGLITTIPAAFPGFGGGANVAMGDINNDGFQELVVGAGPGGGPHVKIYDGAGLQTGIQRELRSFF